MRLARIDHERCSEISATTYVWVPDSMSDEEFNKAVSRASKAYLDFLDKWKEMQKEGRPNNATSYSKPPFEQHPDKTVAEVTALHEEAKLLYKEWEAANNQAHWNDFSWYLEQEGLINFYANKPELETTVYWGHRHGTPINYAETEVAAGDFKAPEALYRDEDW